MPKGINSDSASTSPATVGAGAPARVQSFVLHPDAGQAISASEDEACRVQQLLRTTLHAIVSGELEGERFCSTPAANLAKRTGTILLRITNTNVALVARPGFDPYKCVSY